MTTSAVVRPGPTGRTGWLGILARVGRQLTAADSDHAVAAVLVGELADELDVEAVSLRVPSPDGRSLLLRAVAGRNGHLLPPTPLDVNVGCVGRAFREGRTLLVEDVEQEPDYRRVIAATRSELAVPLWVEGRLAGVLDVEASTPGLLTTIAVDVVEAVVAQAGVVLELVALRRRDESRLAEQAEVHTATLDLLVNRPLEDTLRSLVGAVRRLGAAGEAAVWTVEPDGRLRLLTADGRAPAPDASGETERRAGTVVENGEPVVVHAGLGDGAVVTAGVPLRHGNAVIGVVTAIRAEAQAADADSLLRSLTMLAPTAALAIGNARRTETQLADIVAAGTVAHRLAAGSDQAALRSAVVEMAVRQIGATAAALWEPLDDRLTCTTQHGFAGALPDLPLDGPSAAVAAMRSRRAVFVPDLAVHSPHALAYSGGCRSAWVQPLVREGRSVGVLVLGWPLRSEPPSGREVALIALLAGDAGAALERADLFARLEVTARRDALTGTSNRRHWDEALPRFLAAARARDEPFTVAMLDLDHFKAYNDLQGHQRGDDLLRTVGAAWRARLGADGVLARYGGEEFAVAFPATPRAGALEIVAALRELVPDGQTCSAGVAEWDGSENSEAVIARADAALYQAKRSGRDRVVVAHRGGDAETPEGAPAAWTRWTGLVPELVRRRLVKAVFQPVVDLDAWRSGRPGIVGYEALARPTGPLAGMGVDGLFAAAQYRGMAGDLDWVCRRAALEGAAQLPDDADIFVNVGISTLLDPVHDVDQLLLILEHTGVAAGRVVLEVSERDSVVDGRRLGAVLARYRATGLRIAVDDVGEGHSTLDLLTAAEPDFIKVAGALGRDVEDAGARAAVRAVVAFAAETGAQVIAEGMQHPALVDQVRDLGVTLGQGFVLGAPADPAI